MADPLWTLYSGYQATFLIQKIWWMRNDWENRTSSKIVGFLKSSKHFWYSFSWRIHKARESKIEKKTISRNFTLLTHVKLKKNGQIFYPDSRVFRKGRVKYIHSWLLVDFHRNRKGNFGETDNFRLNFRFLSRQQGKIEKSKKNFLTKLTLPLFGRIVFR